MQGTHSIASGIHPKNATAYTYACTCTTKDQQTCFEAQHGRMDAGQPSDGIQIRQVLASTAWLHAHRAAHACARGCFANLYSCMYTHVCSTGHTCKQCTHASMNNTEVFKTHHLEPQGRTVSHSPAWAFCRCSRFHTSLQSIRRLRSCRRSRAQSSLGGSSAPVYQYTCMLYVWTISVYACMYVYVCMHGLYSQDDQL